MAAREETRDEIDVRTLRELASLPCNKYCFDCGQRGPTYVNVTIGAFVCSACGGLLRGLNPPHRVKSLTVCSFTEVEMDRIKSRGNEYCTHIWLGKCDPNSVERDLTSVEKRREFMIQKYEEKTYYVDPKEAIKKMKPRAPAVPKTTAPSVSQSRSHTIIPNRQTTQLQRPGFMSQTFSPQAVKNVPDLFKELENDPFKNDTPRDGSGESVSFADFGSAFGDSGSKAAPPSSQASLSTSSAFNPSNSVSQSMAPSNITSHKKPAPPPPDRYAALADLDSQFNPPPDPVVQPIPVASAAANVTPFWSANIPAIAANVFGAVAPNPFDVTNPAWTHQSMVPTVNPFQTLSSQPGIAGACMIPPQSANGFSNASNSIPSLLNGGMTGPVWPTVPNKAWGALLQNGQAELLQCKSSTAVDNHDPWAQSYVSSNANPFLQNSSVQQSTQQTNAAKNPFL